LKHFGNLVIRFSLKHFGKISQTASVRKTLAATLTHNKTDIANINRQAMKKLLTVITAATIFLTACNNNKENPSDIFTKVYTADNLTTQTFTIWADKDTTLKGKSGTTLFIPKNTFVDDKGNPVSGQVSIQFKEALTTADMVLANLTTTYDGNFLQSGGMIFINATSDNNKLEIASDKYIGVIMPTDTAQSGMKVFTGTQDNVGINWQNPAPILNDQPQPAQQAFATISLDTISEGGQMPSGDSASSVPLTAEQQKALNEQMDAWQKQVDEANKKFLEEWKNSNQNTFTEDYKSNYIFSIKKLGWANIDRIMDDPRTKDIELITKIENHSNFNTVYVTMVLNYRKMYLPGYQKKDETYSFTHGDLETTRLPVGETAIIIATAYKNDIPYFAIKRITITDKQTVSFKLDETTMDKLKIELQKI
jgi:hypothetical protein